jgi:glucose/arabinose dehydrogenase
MSPHWSRSALLAGAASLVLAATAIAAGPPPPPTAANGHPVTTVATGVATPTSFAFDPAGTMFIGAFGNESTGKGGGVLAVAPGRAAALIPGIPGGVAGLVFHEGTLYVSVVARNGGKINAYSGWNGTAFTSSKTIFNARKTVGTVNGLALGPDGRLYGGGGLVVDVNKKGIAKKSPFPHPYSVFSIKLDGSGFRVVARGLRQPWQMTFVGTSRNPFVSVLSQDAGKIPQDAIVVARRGSNYGFPKCFAGVGISCKKRYAKPLITLPRHASPMGIQAVGNTLYVALFGGIGKSGPEVVTIPAKAGAKPTPFLTGFAAPVVAVGISGGALYAGDLTGSVYRVAL